MLLNARNQFCFDNENNILLKVKISKGFKNSNFYPSELYRYILLCVYYQD